MKKQNNNETNNNTGVNEIKPPKKKMKVSTIVIIVLVVLLLFSCVGNMGGSDSSSSSTTTNSTTTEDKGSKEMVEGTTEADVEEAAGQEPEAKEAEVESEEGDPGDIGWSDEEYVYNPFSYDPETDTTHVWVGDVLNYSNTSDSGDVDVTVTDCGILINDFSEEVVYVELEIENNSTEGLTVYGDDMTLYIDGYQITTDLTMLNVNDTTRGNANISSGKKAKTTLRLLLPSDYYKANKIEVDLFDFGDIIIIKDEGYNVYGRRNVLDLLAEALAVQKAKQAQEEAFQATVDRLSSINIDKSLLGDHAGIDNPNMTITLESSYGLYYNAELYIDDTPNNYISAYVRMDEDSERAGYLTFDYPDSEDESENKCGTIYFGMDGIRIELDDYPEYNGIYW